MEWADLTKLHQDVLKSLRTQGAQRTDQIIRHLQRECWRPDDRPAFDEPHEVRLVLLEMESLKLVEVGKWTAEWHLAPDGHCLVPDLCSECQEFLEDYEEDLCEFCKESRPPELLLAEEGA